MPTKYKWADAVDVWMRLPEPEKTSANERYLDVWNAKPAPWRIKHNCGPADAECLLQAVRDVMGDQTDVLAEQADEYEETMKAMEIMEKM